MSHERKHRLKSPKSEIRISKSESTKTNENEPQRWAFILDFGFKAMHLV